MVATFIIAVSTFLQFVAAFLAFRLMRITERRIGWALISIAVTLMGIRRSITLYRLITGDASQPPDVSAELVALAISSFMVFGLIWLAPLFTSIRRSEEALRESELSYKSLVDTNKRIVEHSPIGIVMLDHELVINFVNPKARTILGVSKEGNDLVSIGMKFTEIPSVKETPISQTFETLKNGNNIFTDFPMKSLYGEIMNLSMRGVPIYEDGSFSGAILMVSDITERKSVEEELARFKTTLDMTLDCVFMFDPNTLKFFYVNKGGMNQVGYSYEEMLDMTPVDLKPEFTEKTFRDVLAPMLKGEQASLTFETVHKQKNGKTVPVEIFLQYITPPGESGRFVAIVRDITERKLEEKTLIKLVEGFAVTTGEEFFRELVLHMAETLNVDYAFVGELAGKEEDHIQSVAVCTRGKIIDNFAYALENTPCNDVISNGLRYFDHVQKRFPKDQILINMSIESYIGIPLFDSHNKTLGLMVVLHKGTLSNVAFIRSMLQFFAVRASAEMERTKTEEALRASEKSLAKAQKIAGLGNWDWDIVNNEFVWSDEVYSIFGLNSKKQNATYDMFINSTHTEDRPKVKRAMNGALYDKKSFDIEHRVIRPDGTERIVQEQAKVTYDKSGKATGMSGVLQDITRRKEDEAAFQHTQKLESLGVLAGGIAHDFNNILVGIMGNANIALEELAPNSPTREYVEDVITAAGRAADLAKQMLAYSGKGKFIVKPIDLSNMVEEMTHLLEVGISKNVSLIYRLDQNLSSIEADATQIRQIIMNLVINASEAVGENNGEVTLSTGVINVTSNYLDSTFTDQELPEGGYVYLEVSDNGCGMTNETVSKIFDPFFTTKFTGRGLGLAAVIGIVRGHNGTMKVHSEPGKGATFKILFPSSDLPAEAPKETTSALGGWNGNGCVLVVDDEKAIINVAQRMLNKVGFDVLVAFDGVEAIDVFKERLQNIDLVLLDMTMPRMDGEATFREMRLINPNVRVILSSGYNEQDATSRFAGKGLAGFIQKPYTYVDLVGKVREAMETEG